jgi:hypothetical protein
MAASSGKGLHIDTTLSEDDFKGSSHDGLDVNLSEPSPRRVTNSTTSSSSGNQDAPIQDGSDDEDEIDEDALDAQEDMSWREIAASAANTFTNILSVYRLPLMFAFVTAAGPRCVKLLEGIASSDVLPTKKGGGAKKAHGRGVTTVASTNGASSSPYPVPPSWMRSARVSIPRSVESTMSTVLHAFGIPTLSEVQQEQLRMQLDEATNDDGGSADGEGSEGTAAGEQATGGIPFALLVPVASAVILLTAKLLIARHARRLPSDNVSDDDDNSRSPLQDPSEANNAVLTADDGEEETSPKSGNKAIPHIKVPDADPNARPNASLERNTTRSTASSEPTHGLRTTDPSRSTPRTAMLRQNSDALTGSIQKRRLDQIESSPSTPGRVRIPELNEQSVETPPGITTIASREGSPKKSTSPLHIPQFHSLENVCIALIAPATHVEISALVSGASKYGVTHVVVPRARRDGTTAAVTSGDPSVTIEESDDVVAHCKAWCSSHNGVSVAVVGRQMDSSMRLRDFRHPRNSSSVSFLYCLDPQLIAGDIVSHHTPSKTGASDRSPTPVPSSLAWCDVVTHVDHIAQGVAGLVNVCLLDHTKKLQQLQMELSNDEVVSPS